MALSIPGLRALLEAPEPYSPLPVSERLVQAIWYDQRLQKDKLQTADGRALRVIAPGQWNLEAGPDFLRATLEFDNGPPHTGDVEIHLVEADWKSHGHTGDPAYRNVILHVVLWKSKGDREPDRLQSCGILWLPSRPRTPPRIHDSRQTL